jgi:hypothetical protein
MDYQVRGRHGWLAAGGALAATVAITGGSLIASGNPAFAWGRPWQTTTTVPPTTTTSTTSTTSTTVAPTTTTSTTSGNLSKAQAWGAWLIKNRVNALNWEIKQVQGDSFLGSDGATLVSDMQADITGLQGLGASIASATSIDQVNTDNASIFAYRVYDFMLPMARDVVQVDRLSNLALPAISKTLGNLQGLENTGNQAVLGRLLTDIQSQQQTASGAVSGLSGELLGYTVADWSSNHNLFSSPDADIATANRAVNAADKDCDRAYAYLRWLRNHGNGTTTTTAAPTTTTTVAPTTTTTVVPTTTTTAAGSRKHGHGHGRGRGYGGRPPYGCRRHFSRCITHPRPHHRGHPTTTTTVAPTTTTAATTTTTVAPTTTTTVAPTTTTVAPSFNCSADVIGTVLSRTGWVASTNAPSGSSDAAANALDGNLKSRFSTDEDQKPGLYFEVDLGSSVNFDELIMDVPNSPHDYARGYLVEVSNNGSSWTALGACKGTGTSEIVSFPSQTAQYVKVVLTTSNANWWWSIDEFYLNG